MRSEMVENDVLREAVTHLRSAIVGTTPDEEREWAGVLWYGLARLEKALRQQLDNVVDPDGLASEVDQTRPTLVRQQEKLRDDYRNLLEQCMALKWELYRAAQPYLAESDRLGKQPPWKDNGDALPTPDWTALSARIETMIDRIAADHEEETSLVQESATVDIGAGD